MPKGYRRAELDTLRGMILSNARNIAELSGRGT